LKRYSILVMMILVALTCALPLAVGAQQKTSRRRVTKPKMKPRSTPAPAPTPTPLPDMRPEATRIATQIKNITMFLYTYGKIVNSLEIADLEAKKGQIPPDIIAKNKTSKIALVNNISALRAGLSTMLKELQTNPRFQVQYLKLFIATESVISAERMVSAGRYDEAGRSLIQAVDRLTDTILSMRLQ
jgi:hypothetical protein